MNAHDLIKEAIAEKGKFDSVYWIACGGSMIDLIPAHELLQREATTFTSYIYTAREFDIMRPRRLGEKSLVIACSHSGNTPEVVEGCEIALAAGATVIAQTDNAGSKIDSGKWITWVYPWGEGVPQAEVPAGISLSLAAELLDQQEGYADLADMYAGIAEMDKILPPAREKVNAELAIVLPSFARSTSSSTFWAAVPTLARPTVSLSALLWRCSGSTAATSTLPSTSTAPSRLLRMAFFTSCRWAPASAVLWTSAPWRSLRRIPIR